MGFLEQLRTEVSRWVIWGRPLTIEPVSGLEKSGASSWEVTGEKTAWRVIPPGGIMPRGWYVLSLHSECAHSQLFVKLYPDYGAGFAEDEAFAMTAKSGRKTKRICYFPEAPRDLRLAIEDAPSNFEISSLGLDRVFRGFAIACMMGRLHANRSHPQAEKARRSNEFLGVVLEIYDKCVSRKESRVTEPIYNDWLKFGESWEPEKIEKEMAAFLFKPRVSVLLPVCNATPGFLRRSIESVQRQSYPEWQLCIVDDASTVPEVRMIVEEYASMDDRIEFKRRAESGHASLATNDALGLARGEYVALLDQEDELAEHALFEVVAALNEDGSLDILYSDEDEIDSAGMRSDPNFKSAWNPELLMAHNYVTNLCVYRRSLIEEAGGFRTGVEGAQDYDLLLRASALTTGSRIRRISKVLYHRRSCKGSTALAGVVKHDIASAGRKALEDHLEEQGHDAEVEAVPGAELLYRVRWALPREPLVSLIIPTRDQLGFLAKCVESILAKTTYSNFEILVIDNGSVEAATLEWFEKIQQDSRVVVHSYDRPFNYSAINNFGVRQARGEIIGLINNDMEIITPGWLEEMVSLAMRPCNGCVGAKLYFGDSTVQHGGVILGLGRNAGHAHRFFPRSSEGYFHRLMVRQNFSAVTAACLLVRREVYEEVGGLEEELAVALNDVDFCLRVREAGYLNVFTPFAELFHFESKSRGIDDTLRQQSRARKEERYLQSRWGDVLPHDPYYNPNLTKGGEDFYLDVSRMLGD